MTQHHIYAGTHGHVLAIDKRTGKRDWITSLPSTGYSVVSIIVEDGLLYCASGGRAFALDPEDGHILWENSMPGLGRGLVYLATERSSQAGQLPLAAKAAQDAAASS